jgi:hypothetical protein
MPLGPPNAYATPVYETVTSRICNYEYEYGSLVQSVGAVCGCGLLAIGACRTCQKDLCGRHATLAGALTIVCDKCPRVETHGARSVVWRRIFPLHVSQRNTAFDLKSFTSVLETLHKISIVWEPGDFPPGDRADLAMVVQAVILHHGQGHRAEWLDYVRGRQQYATSAEAGASAAERVAEEAGAKLREAEAWHAEEHEPLVAPKPSGLARFSYAARERQLRDYHAEVDKRNSMHLSTLQIERSHRDTVWRKAKSELDKARSLVDFLNGLVPSDLQVGRQPPATA